MIEVAETYLGNIDRDRLLAQKVAQEKKSHQLLEVSLTQSDRNKGRIATELSSGVSIGIVKSRNLQIQEGDVFQTNQGNLLLIHLNSETVMVLHFTEAITHNSAMKLVSLGHLLGNHHYPIKIEEHKIYVRLTTESKVIIQMIEKLAIAGLTISWEQVSPLEGLIDREHHH
jgi:urease accessory protein